jgi:hypothetical protein
VIRTCALILATVFALTPLVACGPSPTSATTSTTPSTFVLVGQTSLGFVTEQVVYVARLQPASGTTTDVTNETVFTSSNPSVISMTPKGLGTVVGTGTATVTGTRASGQTASLQVSLTIPEDCSSYTPSTLSIGQTPSSWLLLAPSGGFLEIFNSFDTESDARDGLAVAMRATADCFIGRNNTRANRKAYIIDYWKGSSGISTTVATEDCIPYNRSSIQISSNGSAGWVLTDGGTLQLTLDNSVDASAAFVLAGANQAHCFVGRLSSNPMEYWK